jgi:hypothetical protein
MRWLALLLMLPMLGACASSGIRAAQPSPWDKTVISGNSPYATSRPFPR